MNFSSSSADSDTDELENHRFISILAMAFCNWADESYTIFEFQIPHILILLAFSPGSVLDDFGLRHVLTFTPIFCMMVENISPQIAAQHEFSLNLPSEFLLPSLAH